MAFHRRCKNIPEVPISIHEVSVRILPGSQWSNIGAAPVRTTLFSQRCSSSVGDFPPEDYSQADTPASVADVDTGRLRCPLNQRSSQISPVVVNPHKLNDVSHYDRWSINCFQQTNLFSFKDKSLKIFHGDSTDGAYS